MSALTSLLVRDDAVSVRQIEEALARQVVDGGELDTALLELSALPENKLIAYRAASERAQPATREEVMSAGSATRALLPGELAIALQVSPLFHADNTLTVAAVRALKPTELAQLAERTGMQISYRVTAELRLLAALERFYGHALLPRHAVLLNRVDAQAPGELVQVQPMQAAVARPSMKTEQLPAFEEAEDFQAVLAAAFERASMSPHAGTPAQDPDETRPLSAKRAFDAQRRRSRASEETARLGSGLIQARPVRSAVRVSAAPNPSVPPAGPAQSTFSMADAQGALATAEDRDAVMDIYFRFARQRFLATVLFTLKDGRAHGAQANNVKLASDIRDVSLPLVRGSALEELTRMLLPRVTDLGHKDEDRVLVSAIKRLDSQPAALVPICIKRRVVAVLYGDRAGGPLHLDELTDLFTLMPHVTGAFERIIRARKALGLFGTPSHIGELSHAPTQRSMPAQPGFSSEPRTTELSGPAKQALEALKIPQALPPTKGFGQPDDDGDIYATARIPIQPLPLDQFESPPRYLSKPPPGAGRYQSVAPKGRAVEEPLRPSGASSEERTASGRRLPARPEGDNLRQAFAPATSSRRPSQAPPPGRRNSAPPVAGARRSVAPAPQNAPGHPSLASPKPAPGSGVYHSQMGTTELINMPPRRVDAAPPSHEPAPSAHGFFLGAEAHPVTEPGTFAPEPVAEHVVAPARAGSSPPSKAADPVDESRPAQALTQLIDALCRSEPNEDPPALKALVGFGEPALSALLARFPGPLWFDRRKPHARLPLGRDISPICRALDAFGDQATDRLGPVLGSNVTEVRYYATLFAGDRVRPNLLEPLLTRLFDDDPQIRLLVRDALPHYRKFEGFARVTERICERARAESAPLFERLAAIDAICMLRDAGCVSTLIELIGHRDKQICVPAHRALTLITCQDFGKAPRKWRGWLNANSDRHRVEWLIEGLMHSEEPMRATAGLELQKLTQVYYGYVAAASKREREAAQKRYAEWWRTEGRTRIAT